MPGGKGVVGGGLVGLRVVKLKEPAAVFDDGRPAAGSDGTNQSEMKRQLPTTTPQRQRVLLVDRAAVKHLLGLQPLELVFRKTSRLSQRLRRARPSKVDGWPAVLGRICGIEQPLSNK